MFYLQRDVLSEGDVSRHGEVIELQHVRDVLKPGQKLLNLQNRKHHPTLQKNALCSLPLRLQDADVGCKFSVQTK